MNYYKQGSAANADKIKAAFEKKGFIKEDRRDIYENNVLFFTVDGDKNVHYCWIDQPYCNIVKTHPDYKELELPVEPKFKVGDWVVDGDRVAIIYDLQKNGYVGHDVNRKDFVCRYSDESRLHLWAIADAKDGDVLATDNGWTCIFKAFDGCVFSSYCFMDSQKWFCEFGSEVHTLDSRINGNIHPATKEQRDLLFKKMWEAGYEWDEEKKELCKIQPHYDIANFHAGMPVLVRPDNDCCWDYSVFSRNTGNEYWHFAVCNGVSFTQCIPFNDETKHLLGTTDMPDERFINW